MRITCVIPSLGLGGAQRNILWLGGILAAKGAEVTLVSLDMTVPDFFHVQSDIKLVHAPLDAALSCRWYDLKCQRRREDAQREVLENSRPDLVISFVDTTNISVLKALAGSGIPVIVSERINPRYHVIGWRWDLLRRIYYPKADKVIMLAEEALPWARSRLPKWDVCSIPNPVFIPTASSCLSNKGTSGKHLVAMGRLHPQKGFDLLLGAFSRIAADFPGWNLTILGEGEERPVLEDLVNSLALAGRVDLPGAIEDAFSFISKGDIFVFPSRYEGFGMALAEAMACGLPVISFDCPSGPRRIVRHEVDGLLVPPQDTESLSKAMRRLMSDESERKRFAARAPEVMERFSPDSIFNQWLEVISEVTGKMP